MSSIRAGTRPILPKIYCCRTLLAFRQSIKSAYRPSLVEISGKRTFRSIQSRTDLSQKFTNYNHNNRLFLILNSYKACCCDERCESVESPLSSTTAILSLTSIAAYALWEPRKSSRIFQLCLASFNSIQAHPQEVRTFCRAFTHPATFGIVDTVRVRKAGQITATRPTNV